MSQEHVAAMPNGSNFSCPETFRSQENYRKFCSNEVKMKDISIMNQGTRVVLLRLYGNVYVLVSVCFFELFPIKLFVDINLSGAECLRP